MLGFKFPVLSLKSVKKPMNDIFFVKVVIKFILNVLCLSRQKSNTKNNLIMNNHYKKILILLTAPLFLFSCGGEDLDDMSLENFNSVNLQSDISVSQLVGYWKLSAMTADTLVDLDGDGTGNTNLLLETNCFDPMAVTFREDMTFTSVNARMDFRAGESNDKFACMGQNEVSGTWSIEGNTLTLNAYINGVDRTHTKELTLTDNTFSLPVYKWESDQYVTSSSEGTAVSEVLIVELEYTK